MESALHVDTPGRYGFNGVFASRTLQYKPHEKQKKEDGPRN